MSSHEIHRTASATQESAWFMNPIRLALGLGPEERSQFGELEAYATFIGGKARKMHAGKRKGRNTGTGGKDKPSRMGIMERGGKVRTKVIGAPSR